MAEILDNKQLTEKLGALSEFINNKLDIDAMNSNSSTGGLNEAGGVRTVVEVSDKSLMPSWYRVYSDGWCEQGGIVTTSGSGDSAGATVTFLKEFKDTNYNTQMTCDTSTGSIGFLTSNWNAKTTTTCRFISAESGSWYGSTMSWTTSGYIS